MKTPEITCRYCGTAIREGEPRAFGYHVLNEFGDTLAPLTACFYKVDCWTGVPLAEGDEGDRIHARAIELINEKAYAERR